MTMKNRNKISSTLIINDRPAHYWHTFIGYSISFSPLNPAKVLSFHQNHSIKTKPLPEFLKPIFNQIQSLRETVKPFLIWAGQNTSSYWDRQESGDLYFGSKGRDGSSGDGPWLPHKGVSAQELPRVDPEGKLWTGWSEWYGCAGQTFYQPSELCAFPERRKLKSYSQGYSRLNLQAID